MLIVLLVAYLSWLILWTQDCKPKANKVMIGAQGRDEIKVNYQSEHVANQTPVVIGGFSPPYNLLVFVPQFFDKML